MLGKMNGLRVRTVSTSLGEWISSGNEWSQSPGHPVKILGWPSAHGVERVPPQGVPGACGAMLLRGFRLFGVALHRKPSGAARDCWTWRWTRAGCHCGAPSCHFNRTL